MKIKATLEYWGNWRNATEQNYRLVKLSGSPTVEVMDGNGYTLARIGDMLNEKQAVELASRIETTTIGKTA